MIKSYYEFVYDKPLITQFNLFSKENYKMFLDVKKVALKIEEKASNNKTEKTERLNNLKKFFYQYIKDDPPLFFFDFNSNLIYFLLFFLLHSLIVILAVCFSFAGVP